MTHIEHNVEGMLADLSERSQTETDFVRRLSDAIRRVDDQLLRDVRNVSLQHEVRREAILGELQGLAVRLCALPARAAPMAAIGGARREDARTAIEAAPVNGHAQNEANRHGGDWRRAAQAIDEELEMTFGGGQPRH